MGKISIFLNVVTVVIILYLLRAIRDIYKFSEHKDMSIGELFRVLEKEPSSVSHAYFYEHKGIWSTGDGYDWEKDAFAKEGKDVTTYDIQEVELFGLTPVEIRERLRLQGKTSEEIDSYFNRELMEDTKAKKNLDKELISRLTRS